MQHYCNHTIISVRRISMSIAHLIEKTNLYTAQNSIQEIIETNKLAHQILNEIAFIIKPGMRESEAVTAAHNIFTSYDITKLWHRPLIRFNQHTLCSFKDRPQEDLVLQEKDIAFIDIGIVKNGIEGDVGKTLVFGENQDFIHLKNTSENLFAEAVEFWRSNHPTGIELYDFIYAQCKKHNVLFNLSPAGHLIGAFPHTHAWTKGMNIYPEKLVPGGWILEIQIKSINQPHGAFYEALLI